MQAATGALTVLAGGGDLAGALAAASAPELANIIGHHSGLSDNDALIAHALLGGVVASLQGKSAGAGAAGALTGELAARAIKAQLFPGKDNRDLDEADKQLVSNLATLASGLAGNIVSGNASGTTAGAQAGKNAAENNLLGKALVEGCAIAAPCRTKVAEQLLEIGVKAGITGAVAKTLADKLTADELDHLVTLEMMGNDEVTSKYLSSLQDKYGSGSASNPNIGKDLTDGEKAELGGAGSGSPGGWEPQDEENARNSQKQNITVEDLTSTSSKGPETTGRSKLFERTGGSNAANKEFDALSPTEIKEIPSGRVGKLPDGRTVIVRERSTDGRPTLEIQSGKNRIKFRYDE
ncbi:hypothetical protein CRH15_20865 [Lelliottia amnigena]|nr:hypothetical protein CRH15_20865 [Lelliottia amnigena]